jgi:uncharacterized protein involved in cysteine biosynthesis
MILNTFLRSFRTLFSPNFFALFVKTSLITVGAFSLFMIAVTVAIINLQVFGDSDGSGLASIGIGLLAFIFTWFLLPTIVPLIAAFFQETIADRIEHDEYPEYMPPAVKRALPKELWEDTKFVLFLIFINILMIPTFILGIGAIVYFFVNSYFVGREFFETAAARHLGREEAKRLRKNNRLPVLLNGAAIVMLSITPILNFTAPFIGVALMVHLLHYLHQKVEILPPSNL